jgi:hypothetical protein
MLEIHADVIFFLTYMGGKALVSFELLLHHVWVPISLVSICIDISLLNVSIQIKFGNGRPDWNLLEQIQFYLEDFRNIYRCVFNKMNVLSNFSFLHMCFYFFRLWLSGEYVSMKL